MGKEIKIVPSSGDPRLFGQPRATTPEKPSTPAAEIPGTAPVQPVTNPEPAAPEPAAVEQPAAKEHAAEEPAAGTTGQDKKVSASTVPETQLTTPEGLPTDERYPGKIFLKYLKEKAIPRRIFRLYPQDEQKGKIRCFRVESVDQEGNLNMIEIDGKGNKIENPFNYPLNNLAHPDWRQMLIALGRFKENE